MKKILITICLLISAVGTTQVFENDAITKFTKESVKDKYSIFFPSAYGFVTLHHLDNVMMDNTKGMVLTQYDQELQAGKDMSFNLPKLGNRAADLVQVVELDKKLLFFSKVMHKKSAKHQMNVQVFDLESFTVSDNKVLSSFAIEGYSKSGFYNMAISPDKSKFAIVANMPFEKKKNEKLMIWVYDSDLNLVWEKSETIDFSSKRAYNEKVFVQNSGEVVMVKTINEAKKTRRTDLLTFTSSDSKKTSFSEDGFMPLEMDIVNVNGISMLSGFYWDAVKVPVKINAVEGDDTNGAFLYDLGAKKIIGKHEFNDDLNNKYDYKSLIVTDIVLNNDDLFLFGERQLSKSEFKKNGNSVTTELDYFYTFGSSLMVNMDTKGTLKKMYPLYNAKDYKNEAKETAGYAILNLSDGLFVFSNTNGYMTMNQFFTGKESKFNYPEVKLSENASPTNPAFIPHTFREVKGFGLAYYIASYANTYWISKMTW